MPILELPDDEKWLKGYVMLPDYHAPREALIKILENYPTIQDIDQYRNPIDPEEFKKKKMSKEQQIKETKAKLEKLTGKRIVMENALVQEASSFNSEANNYQVSMNNLNNAINAFIAKYDESKPGALGALKIVRKSLDQNFDFIKTAYNTMLGESETCVACSGEGFDNNGAECEECNESVLREKDKEGGVKATGEPIQFYAPKGTRKKLAQMAKRSGRFTMSDFIRNKLFGTSGK